jgi:hypothetical protein
LLKELKHSRTDWEGTGGKKGGKLHQFLTVDAGHPRLKTHLEGVVMIMRFARDWQEFMYRMDVAYPKMNETRRIPFPVDDEDEEETLKISSPTLLLPPSSQSPSASPE